MENMTKTDSQKDIVLSEDMELSAQSSLVE